MITHTFTANAILNGKPTHIAGELEDCTDIPSALISVCEFIRQIPVHLTLKDLQVKPYKPSQRALLRSSLPKN